MTPTIMSNRQASILQTWTMRDAFQLEGVVPCLTQARDMGFDAIEVGGIGGASPIEFRGICNDLDLQIVGIHQASPFAFCGEPLSTITQTYLSQASAFGATEVITMFNPDLRYRHKRKEYYKFASDLQEIGKALKPHGVRLYVHCYDHDLIALPGYPRQSGFDALIERTAPETLGIELDLFFCHRANRPVSELAPSLRGRNVLVHLNDCMPSGSPAAIGRGSIDMESAVTILEKACRPKQYIIEQNTNDVWNDLLDSKNLWGSKLMRLIE